MAQDKYDIMLMQEAYGRLGSYAAVGRELGMSASTVSKYLKSNPIDNPISPLPTSIDGETITPIDINEVIGDAPLGSWFLITDQEIEEAELYRRRKR